MFEFEVDMSAVRDWTLDLEVSRVNVWVQREAGGLIGLPNCDKYGGHLWMVMFAVSLFVRELTAFSPTSGYVDQYSDRVTNCMCQEHSFASRQWAVMRHLSKASSRALGPTQRPHYWVPRAFSPWGQGLKVTTRLKMLWLRISGAVQPYPPLFSWLR